MNNTEKRRKQLLEQTRILYNYNGTNPAIHPRYKASYRQVYPEDTPMPRSTFGLRCLICVFIFYAYIMMTTNENTYVGLHNLQVRNAIMQNSIQKMY